MLVRPRPSSRRAIRCATAYRACPANWCPERDLECRGLPCLRCHARRVVDGPSVSHRCCRRRIDASAPRHAEAPVPCQAGAHVLRRRARIASSPVVHLRTHFCCRAGKEPHAAEPQGQWRLDNSRHGFSGRRQVLPTGKQRLCLGCKCVMSSSSGYTCAAKTRRGCNPGPSSNAEYRRSAGVLKFLWGCSSSLW